MPGPLPRVDILSAEGLVQTRLVANKVLVRVSDNPPRGHVAEKAYVVKQRQNDIDTGLALTPGLRIVQGSGEIGIQEDTREWWVVHIPSGRTISHRGYTRIEEAHMLASYLAQIDWTRDLSEISAAEITRTNNSISSYDQSLAQHKMSSQAGPAVAIATATAATAPPPPPGPLLGTLVADNQGGLARVLGEEGSKLFLMDFQGHRYETERAFVRQPTEADYNIAGTAMPVDPTIVPDEKCTICGARAKEAPAGTKWLKMEWKTYCDSCGPEHQRAEAFLKEEDIGTRETL
ncbi:MAG: hypothetical protein BroJett011_59600 [Chloroflexota bacterium]|nr:MAG: hypothetical protein BroJett011_59600 [Chloroflexota bacterium]